MLFQTSKFLIFFTAFYLLFLVVKDRIRLRNIVILIASYVFYGAWSVHFLWLILGSTLLDFYLGLRIADSSNDKHRRGWVIFSVVANLAVLGTFKYFDFFANSFTELFAQFGWNVHPRLLKLALPVGISFYTFESMSYVIDVYRRKIPACRNLLDYATFIAFFPHLVAGPIIRPAVFFPALRKESTISVDDFYSGLFRFIVGLMKKLILADTLAVYWVDDVFSNPGQFNSIELLVGAYAYTLQIYLDFSGYSDMAIGLSRMLGIWLPENFNSPYLARSIGEFWDRWHISLSTWLRDYLYIPLGGNRQGDARKYLNIFITMLLGGLWHGASWTFVIWGAIHGLLIVGHHFKNDFLLRSGWRLPSLPDSARRVLTFHLVAFAWIFFRAETLDRAIDFIRGIFAGVKGLGFYSGPTIVLYVLVFCLALQYLNLIEAKTRLERAFVNASCPVKIFAGSMVIVSILIFEQHFKPFIYFQF